MSDPSPDAKRGACVDRKELATIATDTKVCMDVQVPEEPDISYGVATKKKNNDNSFEDETIL